MQPKRSGISIYISVELEQWLIDTVVEVYESIECRIGWMIIYYSSFLTKMMMMIIWMVNPVVVMTIVVFVVHSVLECLHRRVGQPLPNCHHHHHPLCLLRLLYGIQLSLSIL